MYSMNYYTNYYNLRKHLYKVRYYEKKDEEQREIELYKEFGGKKEFYKNSLINMGFLIIKPIDDTQDNKSISSVREDVSGVRILKE
jgi:uncharacterized membrane protein